jgi:hypothetical protein
MRRSRGRAAHLILLTASCLLALVSTSAGAADVDPNYPHGTFREDCAICHVSSSWTPARPTKAFDHGAHGFPLLGAHQRSECRACHATLDFGATESACVGCHLDPHQSELGTDCERCHTPVSFIDRSAMIQTHRTTRFPLIGAHRVTDCETCHPVVAQGKLRYVNTPADCESCHLADYLATTDPDHEAAGFPRDCALCHVPTLWDRARFDHSASAFPLTGAHRALACQQCHAAGYAGTPTACASCHMDDYLGTTDPNHQAGGFPTSCDSCHSTTAWSPALFDHSTTTFPLTGAHVTVPCQQCHTSGYAGTPTACDSCHMDDYLATTDPNHQAAGIPTTCQSCHSTVTWNGAQVTQHDALYFPIYSGTHRGRWTSCADCHTNSSNYTTFTCLQCHAHDDPVEVASHHSGVSGYSYTSQACYSCHPRGSAG